MNKIKAIVLLGFIGSQVGFSTQFSDFAQTGGNGFNYQTTFAGQLSELVAEIGTDLKSTHINNMLMNDQNLYRLVCECGTDILGDVIYKAWDDAEASNNIGETSRCRGVMFEFSKFESDFRKGIELHVQEILVSGEDLLQNYMFCVEDLSKEIMEKFVGTIINVDRLRDYIQNEPYWDTKIPLNCLEQLGVQIRGLKEKFPPLALQPQPVAAIVYEKSALKIIEVGATLERILTNYGHLNKEMRDTWTNKFGTNEIRLTLKETAAKSGRYERTQKLRVAILEYGIYCDEAHARIEAGMKILKECREGLLKYMANEVAPISENSRRELVEIYITINRLVQMEVGEIPLEYIELLKMRIVDFYRVHGGIWVN